MTAKFIKIRVDPETREAFQKKAKADGMNMTEIVQGWIEQYLADEINTVESDHYDEKAILKRLDDLEKKVDHSNQKTQTTENQLNQYIQYLDQRIDALENVVIDPMKDEIKGLKSSGKALFNQVRELEGTLNNLRENFDNLRQQTQQQFTKIAQFIKQKLS